MSERRSGTAVDIEPVYGPVDAPNAPKFKGLTPKGGEGADLPTDMFPAQTAETTVKPGELPPEPILDLQDFDWNLGEKKTESPEEEDSGRGGNETEPPKSEFEQGGRLKIVIAGLDQNVRPQAIEQANNRLNEELQNAQGFTGFLKRVWQGYLFRTTYLTKYTHQAEDEIYANQNLLHHKGADSSAYETPTTLRFAHEYDELIHKGERRIKNFDQNEDGTINEQGYALKQRILHLIEEYSAGTLDDRSFEEEKKRVLTEAVQEGLTKDKDGENIIGKGMLYADNLLQIAQNVKAQIEHLRATGQEFDIGEMLANADLTLGEARVGARTEVLESGVEKIMKKLEGKTFINEATLAIGISVAYSLAGWAVKRGIASVAGKILPGIAGGVIAGVKEARALKEERVQHMRERATGQITEEEFTERRRKLEETRYETKSADELIEHIGLLYDDKGELRVPNGPRFTEAIRMLAEVEARIELSDIRKIDLISFTDIESVEKERFELRLALAKAKVDLRNLLHDTDTEGLKGLGLTDAQIEALVEAEDVLDVVFKPAVEASEGILIGGEEGIDEKDRVYRKLRNKQVGKAVFKGTWIVTGLGLLADEGFSFIDSDRQGLAERLFYENPQAAKESALSGAISLFDSDWGKGEFFSLSGESEKVTISDNAKLTLPKEFSFEKTGDTAAVIGPDGSKIEGLSFNKDGTLTAESINKMHQAGFKVGEQGEFKTVATTERVEVTDKQLIENHKDEATEVKRNFWYDNKTPGKYEGSELGLKLPPQASDGSHHINVTGMVNHSTSSVGAVAHWRELAEDGKLQVALSASKGTQNEVFMFNIEIKDVVDPKTGKTIEVAEAVVPPGSPGAELFDGSKFTGKYMEVVENAGKDPSGVTNIRPIATHVGEGRSSFMDTVTAKETQPIVDYNVTYEPPTFDRDVDVIPVIPVLARGGLDRKQPEAETTAPPEGGDGPITTPPGGQDNETPTVPFVPVPPRRPAPPRPPRPTTTATPIGSAPTATATPSRGGIGGSPESQAGGPTPSQAGIAALSPSGGQANEPNNMPTDTNNPTAVPPIAALGPATTTFADDEQPVTNAADEQPSRTFNVSTSGETVEATPETETADENVEAGPTPGSETAEATTEAAEEVVAEPVVPPNAAGARESVSSGAGGIEYNADGTVKRSSGGRQRTMPKEQPEFRFNPVAAMRFSGVRSADDRRPEEDLFLSRLIDRGKNPTPRDDSSPIAQSIAQQALNFAKANNPPDTRASLLVRSALLYLHSDNSKATTAADPSLEKEFSTARGLLGRLQGFYRDQEREALRR